MWEFLDGFMMWGVGVGIYYVCIFVLLTNPRMKEWRNKLIFPNLLLLFLLVNPIIYSLVWSKIFGITLHRTNMCFPVGFIIAYVLSDFWSQAEGMIGKVCALVGLVLVMAMGYNTMWEEAVWKENPYGLSQDVIEASNYIMQDNDEICVMTSDPDFNYFRQYTSKIGMLYGENISQDKMEGRENIQESILYLFSLMELPTIDLKQIYPLAFQKGVDYIVINTETHEVGVEADSYEYRYDTTIGKYAIYEKQGN